MTWTSTVEFRYGNEGDTVWANSSDNPDKLTNVAQLTKTQDWREAAKWLRQWDGGLGGDIFENITVSGVGVCAADLLAMSWVTYENPAEDVLDYLLDREYKELEYLHSAHSTLRSWEARSMVEDLIGALADLDFEDLTFEEVAHKIGLEELPPVEDFIENLRTVADDERAALPQFGLAAFLAGQPEGMLTNEVMEECAARFPSPASGVELERLLDSWLAAEEKPRITIQGFTLIDVPAETAFLHWLLSSEEATSFAREANPEAFDEIRTMAKDVEIRCFDSGMGGAQGAALYRTARDRWGEFVQRLEAK
jgi:hypothetical protein